MNGVRGDGFCRSCRTARMSRDWRNSVRNPGCSVGEVGLHWNLLMNIYKICLTFQRKW